jgi:hypothetical protein
MFVIGVLANASWFGFEKAQRVVNSKLQARKERRSPAKGRRSSKPSERD